ncbi:MAG: hypothetical protein GY700_06520 [Propionibacteriaceae bacterium]|nr:hypothetical protein [Propionibacteriaceae bacterium]
MATYDLAVYLREDRLDSDIGRWRKDGYQLVGLDYRALGAVCYFQKIRTYCADCGEINGLHEPDCPEIAYRLLSKAVKVAHYRECLNRRGVNVDTRA